MSPAALFQFTKKSVSNSSKTFIIIGSILGALSVAFGAFGAHGLQDFLEATGRIETFKTAMNYLWYHTFAILLIGLLLSHKNARLFKVAGICFLVGIVVFSGSLFALIGTGNTSFGMITPIGGLSFIVGWALTGIGVFK